MGQIKAVYQQLVAEFKNDPTLEKKAQQQLGSMVSQIYHAAMNTSDGYCYKFSLPIINVQNLFQLLKLDPVQVEADFRTAWGYPPKTKMYSD